LPSLITFGINREKDIGVSAELCNKRAEKLVKTLGDAVEELSVYVAEGRTMTGGLFFGSGVELAQFVAGAVLAEIAVLQEKGLMQKTLPKKGSKAEPVDIKGYL
jgi:hypothetical protein